MTALPALRAQQALVRALRPVAGPFVVIASSSRDWSSATFEGARHRLALKLTGEKREDRAARLMTGLAETDLALPGAFVADIVTAVLDAEDGPVFGIEALTIRDGVAELRASVAISGDARRYG